MSKMSFAEFKSQFQQELYDEYSVTLQLNDVAGGTPMNKDLIEGWINATCKDKSAEERRKLTEATLEELPEVSEEKEARSWVGFKVDPETGNLYIEGRCVKAMLKEAGNIHWSSSDGKYATNETGFSALPGGYRSHYDGNFYGLGTNALHWSSTEKGKNYAVVRYLHFYNTEEGSQAGGKTQYAVAHWYPDVLSAGAWSVIQGAMSETECDQRSHVRPWGWLVDGQSRPKIRHQCGVKQRRAEIAKVRCFVQCKNSICLSLAA